MKVKVRKRKSPAPVAAEQVKMVYADVQCVLGGEVISNECIVCDRILEPKFINMIDRIHYTVHWTIVNKVDKKREKRS